MHVKRCMLELKLQVFYRGHCLGWVGASYSLTPLLSGFIYKLSWRGQSREYQHIWYVKSPTAWRPLKCLGTTGMLRALKIGPFVI